MRRRNALVVEAASDLGQSAALVAFGRYPLRDGGVDGCGSVVRATRRKHDPVTDAEIVNTLRRGPTPVR